MATTPIDLKNCVISILDGTSPTPESLEVIIGEGNVSYDETRVIEYIKNRGVLDTCRLGDQEPMDVTMDFRWIEITATSGNPPTIEDALKNRGEAAAWVSSDTENPCAPFAVDIVIVHTPVCDDQEVETIYLRDFRYEKLNHDPKTGQISCSGKCNRIEAEAVRSAHP